MKNSVLLFLAASALLLSVETKADDSGVKLSKPIGVVPPLSKEEVQKGVENGTFCTDSKGLANSRGAVINQNGKTYRCVKGYGENFIENKKLVWVELVIKNGAAVTAD